MRAYLPLQLLLRTLPKENPHENPEYQAIEHAIKELKRLYRLQAFAKEVVEADEGPDANLLRNRLELLARELSMESVVP